MFNHELTLLNQDYRSVRYHYRSTVALMRKIAILGSTGSIGKSTLKIVEAFPDRFSVVSLAAGINVDLAFEQARRWRPKIVSMASAESAEHLHDKLKKVGLGHSIEVVYGSPGT